MRRNPEFDGAIVDWLDEHAERGYITTDASLVIHGWNRWMEEQSGRSRESLVGRSLLEVFPELVSRRLDRFYFEALKGQVSVLAHRFHKYLLKMPCSSDFGLDEMQQRALIAPLVREGAVIGTMTVIDDVSERVARENELLAAREQANKANETKDRFIAVLSHDLRTPLTAMLGWSRILRQRANDEVTVLKGADVIDRNAQLQLALMEKMLDISRINSAKLKLDLESVDVTAVVHSTLETLEPLAESKGIQICRTLPLNEPRTAALDEKRFQQIIWNLISNSLKFTPQGGTVSVVLMYDDAAFQLSVADTGKGISPENLSRVFESMWQDDNSGTEGGLGLGLSIVRNLVHLHGGTIRAESPGLGQGAVFTVRIPWSSPGVLNNSAALGRMGS